MCEQGNQTDKCSEKLVVCEGRSPGCRREGVGWGGVRGEKVLLRDCIVCGEETGGRQADGS